MRRRLLCGIMFVGLFFFTAPVSATITLNLENPADGQDISGIVTISGWTFSDVPNTDVSVTLTIDGNDATRTAIPCCGPRADVQAANPGAPLNSAFSLLFNYGILSVGPHTLRVDVTAPNETAASAEATVNVTKLANAQFLSDFSLPTAARAATDANELVVVGAQVTPQGGNPTKVNLRINYATNLQAPVITEAFAGVNAQLFNAVQDIFTAKCALSGCHVGSVPQAEQDLSANVSFDQTVAVKSVEDPTRLRVSPGDADGSYLFQKVIANGNIATGTLRMPLGCSGNTCLSDAEIAAIQDWINAGAPAPQ
ncbi:MAG: hypothetical protein AB7G75_26450 [Candidatus Binatia bacterium]